MCHLYDSPFILQSEFIIHNKYNYYIPPYDSALIIHNRYNYYIYDSCTLNTKLGHFSETLKENQIVPIFKDWNKYHRNSCRGITSNNNLEIEKLFCKIIKINMLFLLENNVLSFFQIGLMPEHRTTDQIYMLLTLIDRCVQNSTTGEIFS